jgi:hypothetical protein
MLNFIKNIKRIKDLQKRKLHKNKSQRCYVQRGSRLYSPPPSSPSKHSIYRLKARVEIRCSARLGDERVLHLNWDRNSVQNLLPMLLYCCQVCKSVLAEFLCFWYCVILLQRSMLSFGKNKIWRSHEDSVLSMLPSALLHVLSRCFCEG